MALIALLQLSVGLALLHPACLSMTTIGTPGHAEASTPVPMSHGHGHHTDVEPTDGHHSDSTECCGGLCQCPCAQAGPTPTFAVGRVDLSAPWRAGVVVRTADAPRTSAIRLLPPSTGPPLRI